MRFFVTGGAGFIASNLVDQLLDARHSVTVYDNLSIGIPQLLAAANIPASASSKAICSIRRD